MLLLLLFTISTPNSVSFRIVLVYIITIAPKVTNEDIIDNTTITIVKAEENVINKTLLNN